MTIDVENVAASTKILNEGALEPIYFLTSQQDCLQHLEIIHADQLDGRPVMLLSVTHGTSSCAHSSRKWSQVNRGQVEMTGIKTSQTEACDDGGSPVIFLNLETNLWCTKQCAKSM
jgi:hypothetical protein